MRINKYVALSTNLSRRSADEAIGAGRIYLNGSVAALGDEVFDKDKVFLDSKPLSLPEQTTTIMFNKPVGCVCSRNGQGSRTIYDLLPPELQNLKPIGRLDKDSSGLLLMTNDGELVQGLTHPKYEKEKVYEIKLDKLLRPDDKTKIEQGVGLSDGLSKLGLVGSGKDWTVTMHEGRNRQIRRTFEVLGYRVISLNRTKFGAYKLGNLESGDFRYMTK